MDIFNSFKNLIVTIFSVALAYFAPIQDMVFTIFFLFLVNCIVGMFTGMIVEHEHFSLRKFAKCIGETLAFYLLVVCLFVVGKNLHNMEGAMQAIGGIIYAILYFYSVNVLRNLYAIFTTSKTLGFLFYLVSFEFVKKIPALQAFQNYQNKKNNENKRTSE